MINRRSLLRGLIATPAIVSISSLMPVRGIIMPVPAITIYATKVVTLEQIRDLLLPGLQAIRGTYDHRQWTELWTNPP